MKKQYYFKDTDAEICYTKESILADMKEDGIKEMKVFEAYPMTDNSVFWCKIDALCLEQRNGICGNDCRNYDPCNGRSGCCKHYTKVLYYAGDEVTLKVEE